MMKKMISLGCLVLAASATFPVRSERALYINFAPDVRYSASGQDSRISFELESGLYGYGHDYGKLSRCDDNVKNCIAFDFMALFELPGDVEVGAEYVVGSYKFNVVRKTELSIAGCRREAYRVDVTKNEERSNSYLINAEIGVLAIITPNFGNKNIPESIFFLHDREGVFARRKEGVGP